MHSEHARLNLEGERPREPMPGLDLEGERPREPMAGPKRKRKGAVLLALALALPAVWCSAQETVAVAEGEPQAGGRPEHNVRFLLPPSAAAPEPEWTAAERARGYVVYTDSVLNSFWPRQKPGRAQIDSELHCRLAGAEYEPIQIGIYGVENEDPLTGVTISLDTDLPYQVRVLGFRERKPAAAELKDLGPVNVPYVLNLGDSIATIAPGHTGTFWITFHADANTAPGTHAGSVTVTAAGLPALQIPLAVEVLPFQLPEPDIAYGMYYYLSNSWLTQNRAIAEQDQAAHGMNSATLYAPDIQLVRDERTPAGRIEFPEKLVEEMRSRIENGLAKPDVPVFLLDYELVNWHSGRIADSLTAAEKQTVARLYNTFSAQHGWPQLVAALHDEPTVDQPPSYFTTPQRPARAAAEKPCLQVGGRSVRERDCRDLYRRALLANGASAPGRGRGTGAARPGSRGGGSDPDPASG